ncbi:MAG: hypothetical protein DCF13_05605 [Flavobacteriaceae bacterium]|jgi:hypothetical protein|uniref:hypothetical protein n=1 Tax=Flavobacterium macrobrachii TaxID=591204 RepID=UPI000DB5FD76|nr:MAG: hypothetical protein DCF13_05605 [Flavobacteriaceae bacterium]
MAKNVISLEQAQNWAQVYREKNPDSVIAYLIPGIDFKQLLSENGTVDIRAYVGIDPESGLQKLMLVGVDSNGDDMIDSQKGYEIYDFTQPCPDKCDIKSPLFNLK